VSRRVTHEGKSLTWPDADLPQAVFDALCEPGAPFEMCEEDVLGAPMQVFVQRPRTLLQLLQSGAARFEDRSYLVFPERELTFRSALDPVAAVARTLQERYGVSKGDRVAIVAANCVEYALTFWAATALGAVTVALNGWWTGPEIVYALELTRPKILVGDRRRLERLEGHDLGGLPVVVFEDDFAELEAAGAGASFPDVEIDEDDPFVILFTSGTTGRPKGVLLSHRSNIHFLMASSLRGAEGMMRAAADGLPPRPIAEHACIVSASPMFHISGLNCQVVASTMSGMTIVYPPSGKWREDVHLELTEKHQATVWALVPTQLWRLLNSPGFDRYDVSSVLNIGGGSAVWPPELLRKVGELMPGARTGMSLGFGMTETTGLGTSLSTAATYVHADTVGQASPTVLVQLRDDTTGEVVPEGVVGEICLRSAADFLGYWDNPEETDRSLDEQRFYRSGDYGVVRDGFLYLEGRRQDLIIRGGENISPIEIENRLIEHPDIEEVAVVGIDHPTLGQEVAAFVVRRAGGAEGAIDDDDVRAWVAGSLAAFKVPSIVEFRRELPHNPSGKVLKHVLAKPGAASGFVDD
jgi:acyl-CoA synthetase (AMP-forming)/AMP-acid ligase II